MNRERPPTMILVSGILTVVFGGMLLLVRDQVEGVTFLGSLILAGGLTLVGIWLRSGRSSSNLENPPEDSEKN